MKILIEVWRKYLKEDESSPKAIFMAGAPGSGKSTAISELGLGGIEVVNPDKFYEPALEKSGLGKNISQLKDDFFQARQDLKELLSQILALTEPEDGWSHDILEELYASAFDESNGDKTFIYNLETTKEEYDKQRAKIVQQAKLFNQARKQAKDFQLSLAGEGKSFIVDGTGGQFGVIRNQKKALEDQGYDVGMIYLNLPLETAINRQQTRLKDGGRSLDSSAVERSWNAVNKNLELYGELFGNNFFLINADDGEMKPSIENIRDEVLGFVGKLSEDFQSDLKPRLKKQMKRLLRHGGNKDSGPYDEDAPIDYRGSAPPGASGG